MVKTNLIIVGAGGFGREVAAMLKHPVFQDEYAIEGFVDDGKDGGEKINDLLVLGDVDWLLTRKKTAAVVLAIGDPSVKKSIYTKLTVNPVLHFPNIVHPGASLHDRDNIRFGKGNIIGEGNIFTTNIAAGDFNLVNLSCTVGHDVQMGSFCSIMPGVNISGGTILKDEVYIGTGARLINAITLHSKCVIGAGALVRTDVPTGKTFVGVPARQVENEDKA
ncbi:MAG TPA: hypothetical protein DCG19_07910 [Cryomorphaceae bacterium]|nr:hypothetical protein [Owenweeksia sp.]HAD97317.1 hypothetical protein [Cryomorphaceae bacterium]HBF20168.1 hypothetical protein [Cryomorphaceae bacterium]HCQ15951.1 hypothetical protein [Cryomorphaceae bacterium]|tara:strand:+ start:466 stop:1125 length:660 start_codon:yes stop_codon:yes gene_type:complete